MTGSLPCGAGMPEGAPSAPASRAVDGSQVLAVAAMLNASPCPACATTAQQASELLSIAGEVLRSAGVGAAIVHADTFIRTACRNLKVSLRALLHPDVDEPLAAACLSLALASLDVLKQLACCGEVPFLLLLQAGVLPAVVRGVDCEETCLPAWSCLAACARRVAAHSHDFQVRVAAAALWPVLARVQALLKEAAAAPDKFFGTARLHRELVLGLQLALALGNVDDAYFRCKLQQHRVPAALRDFYRARLSEAGLEPGSQAEQVATKLQAVTRKLYSALSAEVSTGPHTSSPRSRAGSRAGSPRSTSPSTSMEEIARPTRASLPTPSSSPSYHERLGLEGTLPAADHPLLCSREGVLGMAPAAESGSDCSSLSGAAGLESPAGGTQ